jgi:hypothetical protein
MGVLVHLKNMETSKCKLLSTGKTIAGHVERGMDFLKGASRTSCLASRYVSMLERIAEESKQHGNLMEQKQHDTASRAPSPEPCEPAGRNGSSESCQGLLQGVETEDMLDDGSLDLDNWLSLHELPETFFSSDQISGAFLL